MAVSLSFNGPQRIERVAACAAFDFHQRQPPHRNAAVLVLVAKVPPLVRRISTALPTGCRRFHV